MKEIPFKLLILLGGFAGFTASYFTSLGHGATPSSALLDGTLGCIVGSLFVRMGIALVIQSLKNGQGEEYQQTAENSEEASPDPSIG